MPRASVLALAALSLVAAAAGPKVPAKTDPAAPAPGAVRITVETIAVDRRGTWSLGSDEADIFSGSTGVLEKSATLVGRQAQSAPREMVQLTARLTPTLKAGGACVLRLETEARSVVAGARAGTRPPPADRKTVVVGLRADEERMIEIYSSTVTDARLALKIRCGTPPAPGETLGGGEARFIDIELSIARADGDEDLAPLKTNGLRATIGRAAGDLFSFNVPLPAGKDGGKRYRREKIEAQLSPTLISGGRLQVEARIQGDVATVSASEPTVAHPVDRQETVVVESGDPRTFDLDVASSGPDEGWSRVRYRIQMTCRF